MYARLTRISGGQVDDDQVIPMTERIMSEARKLDGIQGGYWLRSRDSGDLFAVTLWETEEAMAATEQQAAALREQATEEAPGGDVTVDHCEVLGQF
jgi:heme-degrading monooxygenase HmoA